MSIHRWRLLRAPRVSLPPPPNPEYDIIVRSVGEFGDALATVNGTTVPRKITIDTDALGSGWEIGNQTDGARVLIQGHPEAGQRLPLPSISLVDVTSARNITFRRLSFGDPASTSGTCVQASGSIETSAENVWFDDCEFFGQSLLPVMYDEDTLAVLPTLRDGFGGRFKNLLVQDCYLHDLCNALKPVSEIGDYYTVLRNILDRNLADGIFLGPNDLGPAKARILANAVMRPVGRQADQPGPTPPKADLHIDGFQSSADPDVRLRAAQVEGNVFLEDQSRGYMHLTLVSGGQFDYLRYTDNLLFSKVGNAHAPSLINQSGCYAARNPVFRTRPGTGSDTFISKVDNRVGGLPSMLCDSVVESAGVGGMDSLKVGNHKVGNSLSDYSTVYEGPFGDDLNSLLAAQFAPDTEAGVRNAVSILRAAAEYKVGGPMEHLRGFYDYENCIQVDPSAERTFVPVMSLKGLETGSTGTTVPLPVLGGGTGQAFTAQPGTTIRVADDEDLTNLGPETTSGVVDEMQFLVLSAETAATENASVDYGLTINGQTYSKTMMTDGPQFPAADNQWTSAASAAYSRIDTAESIANQRILVTMFRAKLDAFENFDTILGMGTAGGSFNISASAGVLRTRFVSSSSQVDTLVGVDLSDWRNWVVVHDTTKSGPDAVLVFCDNLQMDVGGTFVATSFNPATILNQLGVCARGNGSEPTDMKISALMQHWGDATYDYSWAFDPHNRNKFNPDQVGAQGEGVSGHAWKRAYWGSVGAADGSEPNTWNATGGLSNRGTDGGSSALVRASGVPYAAG